MGWSPGSRALGVLGAALALTAACASPRARPPVEPGRAAPPRQPAGAGAATPLGIARELLGSPYRYGGASRRGFDCSGLTLYVLARAGVDLPRTTAAQASAGRWVPLDELAVGDLVFFRQGSNPPHHVGIVSSRAGEPLRMIHASTSDGVVETEVLGSRYWLRRLAFGRRVLPERSGASP